MDDIVVVVDDFLPWISLLFVVVDVDVDVVGTDVDEDSVVEVVGDAD